MTSFSNPQRLANLFAKELELFEKKHPESKKLHKKAAGPMMNGVPMSWMKKWPGPYPVYVASAKGAHFRDVDGNDYVDFCSG
jgi:glutamate-1-semialdehyde 2,1-aminomutase